MSLNKREKVNIIIVICFLVTAGVFALDGNILGGITILLTGGIFLFGYRLFEKISK